MSDERRTDPVQQMITAKAVLAPMSGITDIPFRLMCRKFGCKFAFTEMIDINGIYYNNRKTFDLLTRKPEDEPLAVQIVGSDLEKILMAAKVCQDKGFKMLDLNAGCPARKVIKGGKGSALLKDPVKFAAIVRGLVKTLDIPVTVKIRSGWSKESINYMEIAKAAESEGAKAVCLHSRTQEQMYKGKVDHDIVRILKENIKIPVFASGNLFKATDVEDVFNLTGCDGVYIARGALGKPWIFRDIDLHFKGEETKDDMGLEEIKKIAREHFSLSLEYYNEALTSKRMYKHMSWYLKGFKNSNDMLKEYLKGKDFNGFCEFLDRLHLEDERNLVLG